MARTCWVRLVCTGSIWSCPLSIQGYQNKKLIFQPVVKKLTRQHGCVERLYWQRLIISGYSRLSVKIFHSLLDELKIAVQNLVLKTLLFFCKIQVLL
jgi:hypothetical protein